MYWMKLLESKSEVQRKQSYAPSLLLAKYSKQLWALVTSVCISEVLASSSICGEVLSQEDCSDG